ncbi:MAG TPA: hypothetical protein PLB18_08370 [Acidobacteriota bacterium]|nr:hypothetical protein [Acidobacteriota bacterium]HNB73836.1 hypothetical protein [Acidobacteriota bacterium]HND19372.1 hypothetical protein [Acidobacteriota bacterium]HNG94526.1 hypothetical protein [Acidobacteriota bacterium]HNH83836.1 hypothetical protein [Acidobacteriota bacterium]
MKASTLEAALNLLNPDHALSTAEELDEFFVSRSASPSKYVKVLISQSQAQEKFLFTGHRGSGKSTELAKLVVDLLQSTEPFFFPVNYSVKSVLNLFDLTYVDVLLSIGLQLFEKVVQQNMQVSQTVLTNILNFTKTLSTEVQMGIAAQAETGLEIGLYATKLSTKLRVEDSTRLTVRETLSHRISDLLENIDLLVREIERTTHRRTVIIVEDLDKTDLGVAKKLFYEYASSLLSPQVRIIYTFPTALRHDNDFMQVGSNFSNTFIFPNLKLDQFDGTPDTTGRAQLREMITRRVEAQLFDNEALDELVQSSSGLPRELLALGRRACLDALVQGKTRIQIDQVKLAVGAKRRDYQTLLTTEQLDLLSEIKTTRRIKNDGAHQALLHNLSVLEYRNETVWYDVNAIVKALLP